MPTVITGEAKKEESHVKNVFIVGSFDRILQKRPREHNSFTALFKIPASIPGPEVIKTSHDQLS